MNFKHAVLLAPHLDDGELGAGGTILKLTEGGCHVTYIGFYAPDDLVSELRSSTKVLEIQEIVLHNFDHRTFPSHRQEILQVLYDFDRVHNVDLVLTPSTTDIHQDHQTVTTEAIRAFRRSTILGYDVPGNNIEFKQQCFIPLTEEHVAKKVEAVLCYQSQVEARSLRFSEAYVRGKAIACGAHIRTRYAEAFEVVKLVM